MALFRKESAYDRRLRELDEESDRIRKNMKILMKDVSRSDSRGGVSKGAEIVTEHREVDVGSPLADNESPALENREAGLRSSGRGGRGGRALRHADEVNPQQDRPGSERLASYLASGSFGKSRVLSHERRIQRNKAVFMLVFAVIALYSLISWLN